jgi:hypothetical protein
MIYAGEPKCKQEEPGYAEMFAFATNDLLVEIPTEYTDP